MEELQAHLSKGHMNQEDALTKISEELRKSLDELVQDGTLTCDASEVPYIYGYLRKTVSLVLQNYVITARTKPEDVTGLPVPHDQATEKSTPYSTASAAGWNSWTGTRS